MARNEVIFWAIDIGLLGGSQIMPAHYPEMISWVMVALAAGMFVFGILPSRSSDNEGRAGPDLTIKDLFFHIHPEVLDNNNWQSVGDEIRDSLSHGKLKSWGRPVPKDGIHRHSREASREIPSDYWIWADWTLQFFADDAEDPDTYTKPHAPYPEYKDVCVNRNEAFKIWPRKRLQRLRNLIGF